MRPKYYITSSDKNTFDLLFPGDEKGEKLHQQFQEDEMNLYLKYYASSKRFSGLQSLLY